MTIRDPGPDGVLGNGDDGPDIPGFNLSPAAPGGAGRQHSHQPAGLERVPHARVQRRQRHSGKWSLSASGSIRMNRDNDTPTSATTCASCRRSAPRTNLINTDDGRFIFSTWTFKVNGIVSREVEHHVDAGVARAVGPAVRPHVHATPTASTTARSASWPSRIDVTEAGRHRHPGLADRKGVQGGQRSSHVGVYSTFTTSATPMLPRTSRGASGSNSCCRRRSSGRGSRDSA